MNTIAKKAISLLEKRIVKTASVLAVRHWEPATLIEIDLHLPGCDMEKWKVAQHMKCKVGPLLYRDYTPADWDAETQTCTLFIDAGHLGPGSHWARSLKSGDKIEYLGVGSSHQAPVAGKRLVFLGDESSMGHFLALQQIAGNYASVTGAIALTEKNHQEEFDHYFSSYGFHALDKGDCGSYRELEDWVMEPGLLKSTDTVFYLAGQVNAMSRIRRMLKDRGIERGRILLQGFWD